MLSLNLDDLQLRRGILDWQDKHMLLIMHHFSEELPNLFRNINNRIDRLSNIRSNSLKEFKGQVESVSESIYKRWFENQTKLLFNNAQMDLESRIDHVLSHQTTGKNLNSQMDYGGGGDKAIAATSFIAGSVAIPATVTLSTITASVGGFWGLLGVTTTVISWPIAVTGGAVALGLFGFGRNKLVKQKNKAAEYYKNELKKNIRKQVLGDQNFSNSICHRMQDDIKNTALKALKDLEK